MQKTGIKTRLLALLLCFVMVLSTVPTAVLAAEADTETTVAESPTAETEENAEEESPSLPKEEETPTRTQQTQAVQTEGTAVTQTEESTVSATVSFTAQWSGAFALKPLLNLTVSGDTAERYGFTDQTNQQTEVSTVDVLVAAHVAKYGDAFTRETADSYLMIGNNFVTTIFGHNTGGNLCILLNGKMPGNNGIEQATVKSGDILELFEYQALSGDWSSRTQYSDKYLWLETKDGQKLSGTSLNGGVAVELVVKGYAPFYADYADAGKVTGISGAEIYMINMDTGALTSLNATSGEDGTVTITIPKDKIGSAVYLTAKGAQMAMSLNKVTVTAPPVSTKTRLTSLEVAVGSNTQESSTVLTMTPVFDGTTKEYTTPILDYQANGDMRYLWVKVGAEDGAVVTAQCANSETVTLNSGEWTLLRTVKSTGFWGGTTYTGCLESGKYNTLTISVTADAQTENYTLTIPMQPDTAKAALSWKTNLPEAVYCNPNTEKVLTVEAQYDNRPLDNETPITYQWYTSSDGSTDNGAPLAGQTGASYLCPTGKVGEQYYYVIATCGEKTLTSKVVALHVTQQQIPTSISLVCDYTHTIADTWSKALGGVDYVAKVGDTLTIRALDQDGNETPVQWPSSLNGGTLNVTTGTTAVYTITGTSYSYFQVSSLFDSTVKSEEKALVVKSYTVGSYYKAPTVTLSTDGQSNSTITTNGGLNGYTLWSYTMSPENAATLTSDLSKKSNSLSFQALRPGTITATLDVDLDADGIGDGLTDTAILTVNGISVEDHDGNLGKTYLEVSANASQPTVQLQALSSTENASFTWSSSDETVATVNENGLVTAVGVGSVIISAKDGTYTGGIKVVVTSADTPYFETLDFTTTTPYGTGLSNASWKSTYFKAATLNYTGLTMTKAAADTLTFSASTLYDTEKWVATATYTDADGEEQSVAVQSGAATALKNLPLESSVITVTLAGKDDDTIQTVYTFTITRPRDKTKTIANGGIVFAPEGRELWKETYDNRTEGVMYVASSDGSFAQYQGVSALRTYYRTYAMDALESFTLTIKGSTIFTHLRYSVDDGETWVYLGQTGANGQKTAPISFPERSAGDTNPVLKVTIQILDDATYTANVNAGKDGFDGATPTGYYVWLEQIGVVNAECDILTATTPYGDWYPAFDPEHTGYRLVTGVGTELPELTFTVSDGAKVYVDDVLQTPDEQGHYYLTLTEDSRSVVVKASNAMTEKTYTFGARARVSGLYPDKVVDYLPVNSQYTNGNNGGYGLGPQQTLTGGMVSLGNFGGYITFYFGDALTDDPSHPYGVDFYVYGNAFVDTSTGTGLGSMEPGQVWVSEDGSTWYALAGSEHYEDSTLWNYSVTYSKTESGGTTWVDNCGNTSASTHGRAFSWPDSDIYTMNDLPTKDSFTLTGVLLPCVDGSIAGTDNFNSFSKGARFGYVDTLVNGTANPYADNSDYKNASSGFDLAWAVDASGNPVDVSGKSFHYVKVVTASNLVAGAANEKSTEVSGISRAASSDTDVGVTTAPDGVTFSSGDKSFVLDFEEGKQVYEVELPGMETVSIQLNGTAQDDNIYINNQRVASGTAATGFTVSDTTQRLIRIIVQNGEKEPMIYLLKVKKVDNPTPEDMLTGNGTETEPFEIATAADYQAVAQLVAQGISFEGMYLKQTADITLPEDWEGIGCLIDPGVGHINKGKNLAAFSGTLDGGGYTITIAEGGTPLFGYVRGATVKNLNIYGKKIAGYGLVNHLEGVGLSGSAIIIDNVTLKSGSSTEKSGFIGTYITNNSYAGCAASFTVTIRNSKIEENVIIGYNKDQSMIGSFAGRINGTIENCVSYATVYGVDYVGGLVGNPDNAMGSLVISNSKFHGMVEGSGQFAGGILGGGYEDGTLASAPSGLRPSIKDCYVDGTVKGNSSVGGITGGDRLVAQSWNEHSVTGNTFTGTLSGSMYVGGIIGYYHSLNKMDNIAGNTYSGAERGIGYVAYLDTEYENPTVFEDTLVFNTGKGTSQCPTVQWHTWKSNHNRTDDPLGKDADALCKKLSAEEPVKPTVYEIEVSGTYKTDYTVGDALDLSGIKLTAKWTDNTTTDLTLADVEVSGYDKDTAGKQTLTIAYGSVKTEITVTVAPKSTKITVNVSILGDTKHGESGTTHGLAMGGLSTWANEKDFEADANETVWDVLQRVLKKHSMNVDADSNNSYGTVYIKSVNGLGEFDNGSLSGWMFTVNGTHPEVGVAATYVKQGDTIILHYTDDYTKEEGGRPAEDDDAAKKVDDLIDQIGTVSYSTASKKKIDAARKAYDALSAADQKKVTKLSALENAEKQYAALKQVNDEKAAKNVIDMIEKIGKEITSDSETAIKAARTAYDKLTATQKALVTNYKTLTAAEAALAAILATEADQKKADEVSKIIDQLGNITADSEADVQAARKAYDALSDIQKKLVGNLETLEKAEAKLTALKQMQKILDAYKATGDHIENLGTPGVGSIGGEWMAIGLRRSGRNIADAYYESVVSYVSENIDENERLHSAKSTENSRLILALTAVGKDVGDVGGHDLLAGLGDLDFVQKQGINGPIWALIALDSGNYPVPEGNVTREALLELILSAQTSDGGWAISGDEADADMTGMALQALAPYYKTNADVKKAVEEAIVILSAMQNEDGGFGTFSGNGKVATSESTAQVIVALTALGIDPHTDARFVKDGGSAVDALLRYFVDGGGFRHLSDGELDGMATEQGYYALTAYVRFVDGKTSLYDMTDVIDRGGDAVQDVTEPAEDVQPTAPEATEMTETPSEGMTFPWWIVIVVLVCGAVIACVVIIIPKTKKRNR